MPTWTVRPAGNASALYEAHRGRSPSGSLRAPLYLGLLMERATAEQVAREHNAFGALLAAGEALLADADASPDDQEACRRLYNAWRSLREAVALAGEQNA